LRDAWRLHLDGRPELADRIGRLRPEGPLAVSYNRGVAGSTKACRYDLVLVSDNVRVLDMGYEYADAIGAGSDHALVWADLEVESVS
jgi:endonuclease/exonuclease/phosphatase family metal-dependent hydrolase